MRLSTRTQMWGMWCGPIGLVVLFFGFVVLAGLMPPPSPNDSAAEVVDFYRDNTDAKRAGFVVMLFGGAFFMPFYVVLSIQMWRAEGGPAPLAITQLAAAVAGTIPPFVAPFLWLAAAFRPERDPAVTQAFHDIGWLMILGLVMPFMVQACAVGLCAFQDRAERVLPRWSGYFSLWIALLLFPACLLYFFKTGAFAWSGLLVYWLGVTAFGIWMIVVAVLLNKAIKGQAAEERALDAGQSEAMPAVQGTV